MDHSCDASNDERFFLFRFTVKLIRNAMISDSMRGGGWKSICDVTKRASDSGAISWRHATFCEWLNEHSNCSVIYCAIFWESPLNIIFLSDRVHTQPPLSTPIHASTGSAFNKYLVCYLSQLSDDALPCDSQIIHSRRRSQSMGLKINSAWAAEICTLFFLRNENSNCATNYFLCGFSLKIA